MQVSDTEGVKVRAGPSTRARRFCTFDSGTLVQVAGRLDFDGGWLCLKVSPPSAAGHSGTVNDHGVVCYIYAVHCVSIFQLLTWCATAILYDSLGARDEWQRQDIH